MAKQEKRISYQAGITRRPSDFLCQDGELAECINLTTDNEELKPMVQPAFFIDIAKDSLNNSINLPTIIYVHKHSGQEMYIGYTKDGNNYKMEYGTRIIESGRTAGTYVRSDFLSIGGMVLSKSTPPTGIVSIGKIVIISYPDEVYYFLLDASTGKYKGMGSDMDDAGISMDFDLEESAQRDPGQPASFSISGFIHHDFRNDGDSLIRYYFIYTIDNQEYESLKNALNGLVNARLKHVAEQKKFAFPFFVRYAIRLYDGTYTNISQPVLMFPTVRHNCDIFFANQDGSEEDTYNTEHFDPFINYKPISAGLKVKINYNSQTLDNWKDIIAGIDVFVTDPQMPFNLNSDWIIVNPYDEEHQGNMILFDYANKDSGSLRNSYKKQLIATTVSGQSDTFIPYFKPTHYEDSEIMHELSEKSLFYRIAQIDVDEFSQYTSSSFTSLDSKMTQSTLVNLVSQTRLKNDDYFSRTVMSAGVMKAYNERLHLADVKRTFYDGFDKFTNAEYDTPSGGPYKIVVYIKTDSGQRVLIKQANDLYKIMNIWFFYPDTRAERVEIYRFNALQDNYTLLFNIPLTEHKGLNGAYFLDHLPADNEALPTGTTRNNLPDPVTDPEVIKNHLFVSEVDNPFSFISKGDVVVGQGDIIGLATQTQTLGQEEHGIHPLVVFTNRGVVVTRVDNEGYYSRVDELNREICINKKSITETDGDVFFVSKKGLMLLNGKQPVCVSEMMNGIPFSADTIVDATTGGSGNPANAWASIITACKDWYEDGNHNRITISFLDFIRDESCFIAYDYVDKRLLISNPNHPFAFAYNMADGSISKIVLPSVMEASVSDYPDNLLRAASGKSLYTLYGKSSEDHVTSRQRAFILTRPMKLAGPLTVSSLRELVNVGTWQAKDSQGNELSCVKTDVWLSDDLVNWHLMSSRFGAAARYFRIGLFMNMLPTERLSGTILTEQERRTNNLRA